MGLNDGRSLIDIVISNHTDSNCLTYLQFPHSFEPNIIELWTQIFLFWVIFSTGFLLPSTTCFLIDTALSNSFRSVSSSIDQSSFFIRSNLLRCCFNTLVYYIWFDNCGVGLIYNILALHWAPFFIFGILTHISE